MPRVSLILIRVKDEMKIALIRRSNQTTPKWISPELERAGFEFVDRACKNPEEVVAIAGDADIVWDMGGVETITADILPKLTRCGALLRGGSGTDNLPVSAATNLGIIVANTPDATTIPVAEHTVGLMLSMTRKIPMHESAVRCGNWDPETPLPENLNGKTVGLVGFGRIARAVATRLKPFGTRLISYDPMAEEHMAKFDVEPQNLPELLTESDIVSVHTPLSSTTSHLISSQEFTKMKPTSILINTSRGPVIDTKSLVHALTNGLIAAAAVDVLEQEPPEHDPLIGLPNAIVTPHSAAYHAFLMEDFCRLAVDTIVTLSQHKWPISYVNPEVDPRWDMPPKE